MYSTYPSFVLGFHGCDKALAEKIFAGEERLQPSENEYDWLGNGVYFWEQNPRRALEYAQHLKKHPHKGKGKIEEPAVIGAVIDLGYCFNLVDSESLLILRKGYELLVATQEKSGFPIPENKPIGEERDLLLRPLDCAVNEAVHEFRKETGMPEYDTVRGAFWEGPELYPNAGFKEKNHIQICVRNLNCIKGYFRPLDPVDGYPVG
ncbi:hypothetical protein EDC39_107145 [Geothermobacter ehrlichii]|uniref:DUF3990 domain-containing protein n=1 Tax=Geothermobacter ehrlichii TaxID=213224 RepID=A0A5D3WIR0_9BACT|nr:hypothetical protein [Geothermobacter ehrlichii]TYO98344.1 hypothetical protein EDC39_107145 [Geothermobacter ehrlichii]